LDLFTIKEKTKLKEKRVKFDKKVIDIIHQNKRELYEILKKNKINYVNINIFPETLQRLSE